MLTYAVAADTDGTVIDNCIPEKTCSLIPSIVLSEIGNTFVTDDFGICVLACIPVRWSSPENKGFKKCLMGESACSSRYFLLPVIAGYIGKYFVQSSMFAT